MKPLDRREIERSDRRREGLKPWRGPTLTHYGKLADVIRGGGGKLSISVDGDGRKPAGGG